MTVAAKNGLDPEDDTVYAPEDPFTISLTVRSGKILPSVIEEDMTLTADNLYIIPNGTTILAGATVTVEPGTHIQFWSNDPTDPYADTYIASLKVLGRFLVNGTKEDMVYIYPSELMSEYNVDLYADGDGYIGLHYADVTNYSPSLSEKAVSLADHCVFRQNYDEIWGRQLSGSYVSNRTLYYFRIEETVSCAMYKH